jgi:hypothetical protein
MQYNRPNFTMFNKTVQHRRVRRAIHHRCQVFQGISHICNTKLCLNNTSLNKTGIYNKFCEVCKENTWQLFKKHSRNSNTPSFKQGYVPPKSDQAEPSYKQVPHSHAAYRPKCYRCYTNVSFNKSGYPNQYCHKCYTMIKWKAPRCVKCKGAPLKRRIVFYPNAVCQMCLES